MRRNASAGFTMLEMLAVAAILLLVSAIGFPNVLNYRRTLRQTQLDESAHQLYAAAQYRLTQLYSDGCADLFAPGAQGVTRLEITPWDIPQGDVFSELYFLEGEGGGEKSAADWLLPVGSLDPQLRGGQWIVEYFPENGTVYAVFYSADGTLDALQPSQRDALRQKSSRVEAGSHVGYFRGDVLPPKQQPWQLSPVIQMENGEKLMATFLCASPSQPEFFITVTDEAGNAYSFSVEPQLIQPRQYAYTWVMDSLDENEGSFYRNTAGKILCGGEITLTLLAQGQENTVPGTVSAVSNSLFAWRADGQKDTAYLSCGRHLQNLHVSSSHVTENITKAVLLCDISFAQSNQSDSFYGCYGAYAFRSVVNPCVRSLVGVEKQLPSGERTVPTIRELTIEGSGDLGLFAQFQGEIRNVFLAGTRIRGQGSNVGGLIGRTIGDVSLENCGIFLEDGAQDFSALRGQSIEQLSPFLQGEWAGGLVGNTSTGSLTVRNSFAATVIRGGSGAGGLVGKANGLLKIQQCDTGCYLSAQSTGGLVGDSTEGAFLQAEDFCVSGYQKAGRQAAGLMPGLGESQLKRGYAAVSFRFFPAEGEQRLYYTACGYGSGEHVYYIPDETLGDPVVPLVHPGTQSISARSLSSGEADALLGTAFTRQQKSYSYGLLNQPSAVYPYPMLKSNPHYGDWQRDFQEGKLVYFELYSDGTAFLEGEGISGFSRHRQVVRDGYALAYQSPRYAGWQPVINGTTGWISGSMTVPRNRGGAYYIYPLSGQKLEAEMKDTGFYSSLLVEVDGQRQAYFVNPCFAGCISVDARVPRQLCIRSPRQLYAAACHYPILSGLLPEDACMFLEADLDYGLYDWNSVGFSSVPVQPCLGSVEFPFSHSFDGQDFWITGASLSGSEGVAGLFGVVAPAGRVEHVTLVGENSVAFCPAGGNGNRAGVLVGVNQGVIRNCAVTGYSLAWEAGQSGRIGGLVGSNAGGRVENCAVELPRQSVPSGSAGYTIGGFVGENTGSISRSYALGRIREAEQGEGCVLAGFAGANSGRIEACYAALALESWCGGIPFAPEGGTVEACSYLTGDCHYRGESGSFGELSPGISSSGSGVTAQELEALAPDYGSGRTATFLGGEAGDYPYPFAVCRRDGMYVHIGAWPYPEPVQEPTEPEEEPEAAFYLDDTLLVSLPVSQLRELDPEQWNARLLSLAQERLEDVPIPEAGFRWIWCLPEGQILEDTAIRQTQAPICYRIHYDANAPDALGSMEDAAFTYGSPENTLAQCGFERPGFRFAGWFLQEGETADAPLQDVQYLCHGCDGQLLFHGQTVTLYAHWQPEETEEVQEDAITVPENAQ